MYLSRFRISLSEPIFPPTNSNLKLTIIFTFFLYWLLQYITIISSDSNDLSIYYFSFSSYADALYWLLQTFFLFFHHHRKLKYLIYEYKYSSVIQIFFTPQSWSSHILYNQNLQYDGCFISYLLIMNPAASIILHALYINKISYL